MDQLTGVMPSSFLTDFGWTMIFYNCRNKDLMQFGPQISIAMTPSILHTVIPEFWVVYAQNYIPKKRKRLESYYFLLNHNFPLILSFPSKPIGCKSRLTFSIHLYLGLSFLETSVIKLHEVIPCIFSYLEFLQYFQMFLG